MVELPAPCSIPVDYEFHHIGYATHSLEKELDFFKLVGYQLEGNIFSDHLQGITGCFITGAGPRIELLENLPNATTLTPWLDAGVKMYHLAYLVPNMQDALAWSKAQRARVIVAPLPSTAFNGRSISFVVFRNSFIIEFIEKSRVIQLSTQ